MWRGEEYVLSFLFATQLPFRQMSNAEQTEHRIPPHRQCFNVSGYIMKSLLLSCIILFFSAIVCGQNCHCDEDTTLSERVNCDTIKFDNRAKLYWSFNCDSSWLTFESPKHLKNIIFSLGLVIYTGRLGFSYAQEYKNTFLIQNRVISGCCAPSDFYLFDKTTGQPRKNLGILIFYSQDKKLPFVISLTNSSYDTTLVIDDNSLSVYNIEKNKTYYVKLPKGEIERAMKNTEEIHPEYLFDEPILNGTTIYLTYLLNKPESEKEQLTKTITIDLKKYSR